MKKYSVRASDMVRKITVVIKIKGKKQLIRRLNIAKWIFRLGALVAGMPIQIVYMEEQHE